MKALRYAAIAAILLGYTLLPRPARAQFSDTNSSSTVGFSEPTDKTVKTGYKPFGSLSLYPLAVFATGGSFANGTSGTRTDAGALFAGDFGFKDTRSPSKSGSIGLGGWLWTKGGNNLYQIHTRAFFNSALGVQLGYLSSTVAGARGPSYSTFLIYDFNSTRLAPAMHHPFTIETGLGVYIDPSPRLDGGGQTTAGFSLFVGGAFNVARYVSVNASSWYIRDRSQDFTRYALGVSYKFR